MASPNPLAGALMADRGTVMVAARVTLAEETSPSAERRRAPCWRTLDLRTMGIGPEQMTAHGFRAMARTILDEVLGFRPDFIKHRLAHVVRDPSGRSYNRTAFLPERKVMMHHQVYLMGYRFRYLSGTRLPT